MRTHEDPAILRSLSGPVDTLGSFGTRDTMDTYYMYSL